MRQALAEPILKCPRTSCVSFPKTWAAHSACGPARTRKISWCWTAKLLGRPVKWTGDRTDAFQSDDQARDNVVTAELALDERHLHRPTGHDGC